MASPDGEIFALPRSRRSSQSALCLRPQHGRKATYRQAGLRLPLRETPRPGLLDLSPLGSTDLLRPPATIAGEWPRPSPSPAGATYCLHEPRVPFFFYFFFSRRSVGRLGPEAFRVAVDPVGGCCFWGSQEGTATAPAVLTQRESPCVDPYYPSHLGGLQLASRSLRLAVAERNRCGPNFAVFPAAVYN